MTSWWFSSSSFRSFWICKTQVKRRENILFCWCECISEFLLGKRTFDVSVFIIMVKYQREARWCIQSNKVRAIFVLEFCLVSTLIIPLKRRRFTWSTLQKKNKLKSHKQRPTRHDTYLRIFFFFFKDKTRNYHQTGLLLFFFLFPVPQRFPKLSHSENRIFVWPKKKRAIHLKL